jgi:methionyl-tRNA formyltransferase
MKIAFITKIEKIGAVQSFELLKEKFEDVDLFCGESGENLPSKLYKKKYDFLISYISPWIIPKTVLKNIKIRAVNFHPGPPEYPGTGCFNFALYRNEKKYGSTLHIMEPKVDTGRIISVSRFNIKKDTTVEDLSILTYKNMHNLFKKNLDKILSKDEISYSKTSWERKPYKRKDLEDLATLDLSMTKKEIQRRIRCTYYPGKPPPFFYIHGKKFEYNENR